MSRILIVEDENIVAMDIQHILQDMGYDILGVASSGEHCIQMASENCPDLVLMDIRIQGEIDGIKTAEILREKFDLPIVYLTAHADDETIRRAKITAPFGYLLKPFKPAELKSVVEIALSKHDMERRIRQRENWLSTSIQAVGDAVIAVNKAGEITFLNSAAESVTGHMLKDVEGKKLVDVMKLINEKTREQVHAPVIRILKEKKFFGLPDDTSLVGKGAEIPVENTSAILDESGDMSGAVIVFRGDYEDKEKISQQISLADRLTSLGTLVSGVAHEINNPLSVVVANATFVADELEKNTIAGMQGNEDMLDSIKDIQLAAERIRKIVSDLKFFSQPQNDPIKPVDVNGVLDWAIRVTANQVRHCAKLVRDFHGQSYVSGSELRLGQVFVNLIVNAAQSIEKSSFASNEIKISTQSENNRVVIQIQDTGIGMGPDTIKRIFDPFFTTKRAGVGTGLGLSISRGIVNSMGGSISVQSVVGKGTTFEIKLPEVAEGAQVVHQKNEFIMAPKSKVLVVDDEPLLLKLIHRTLSGDHDVTVKESSVDAYQFLKSHPDFDVILCDLMMPEMNGVELYEKVTGIFPEMAHKFVFMSGGAFTQNAIDFMSSTNPKRIDKPFTPAALKLFLKQFLVEQAN
ncbi:MAG: response regulator [Proteobacteria bacterium]|nr:response regulator [Pseudomonadota bacterium]